ncbi:MAG: hypothetical protein HY897_09375 [Deltaproteobacteria bacterium]|nr:hypothetical protein [Deltaproteobacteria bacterium]
MMTRALMVGAVALLIAGTACGDRSVDVGPTDAGVHDASELSDGSDLSDGSAPDAGALPDTVYWKQPDVLTLDDPFYASHPAVFGRMGRHVTHVKGEPRPDARHRGSFGTGNGRVFGFVGLDYPLNTLHSLVGPTYEKKNERFFGDYRIFLRDAGSDDLPDFQEEWAARSLSAPVLVTRGVRGGLELDTVDFAAAADGPLGTCFVRLLNVRNRGTTASPALEIVVDPHNAVSSPETGVIVEAAEGRGLTTRFTLPGAEVRKSRLIKNIGELAPGAVHTTALLHCTKENHEAAAALEFDPGNALEEAAAAYRTWEAGLVQFDLPDPMVADFLDGMKMTLKVQTAATGASCPMSEYTRTWTRDNIGPALAWLDLGAFEDAAVMMDYIYGATVLEGDLQNSYDADLDLSVLPPEPDWISMPAMIGKTAAEGPSYNVITYGRHFRHTGDVSRAAARFGFLWRCLFGQGFGDFKLLPYSGDETYRAAMNAAFGLPLEFPHHEKSFSVNSSLLWLGAAGEFQRLAKAVGRDDDAELARIASVEVQAGTMDHFLLPDGCLSAFVDRETMDAWPEPFEDEALQVTWSGWKDGDDDLARSSLGCLIGRLRREPGVLMSKLDPKYTDWFNNAKKGVYTGMLPGYTLSGLAEIGHPEAEAAFNFAGRSIDTSGNLPEYLIYDDFSGLTIIYDPAGGIGDYTAKFRPWEGGIVFDAVFKYLTGFAPDALAKTISFRPHLPNGWPQAAYRNLRVGEDRFDLELTGTGAASAEIKIVSRAATDYSVSLRWDAMGGTKPAFEIDGTAIAERDVIRRAHFGAVSGETSLTLPAGSTSTATVRW